MMLINSVFHLIFFDYNRVSDFIGTEKAESYGEYLNTNPFLIFLFTVSKCGGSRKGNV